MLYDLGNATCVWSHVSCDICLVSSDMCLGSCVSVLGHVLVSWVMCYVSCVMCYVSRFMSHVYLSCDICLGSLIHCDCEYLLCVMMPVSFIVCHDFYVRTSW